jgi:hypothetical protein
MGNQPLFPRLSKLSARRCCWSAAARRGGKVRALLDAGAYVRSWRDAVDDRRPAGLARETAFVPADLTRSGMSLPPRRRK